MTFGTTLVLFALADVFKIARYDIVLVPVTKVGPGQMN